MPRFSLKPLFALGLCALAVSAFAAPRSPPALSDQSNRFPTCALLDTAGHLVRMKSFLGRKRLVLLFLTASPPPQTTAFLQTVRGRRTAFAARDMVVLVVAPAALAQTLPNAPPVLRILSESNGAVARAYEAGLYATPFYLIGKDGAIKMARPAPPSLRELFGTIDAMPMRREEMRRQSH